MGNWSGAMFRSVAWILLLVVGCLFYEMGMSYRAQGFLLIVGLFAPVYILISMIGWLVIGLPFHWVICQWFKPYYFCYFVAGLLIVLVLWMLGDKEFGMVFGLVATLQAMVFRYYVFKGDG